MSRLVCMNTNAMTTTAAKYLLVLAATLLSHLPLAVAGETPRTNAANEVAAVFLVDDQTGEELAVKHGIQPIAVADLDVLINGVLNGSTPVRLFHQAVDEDATDNTTAQMEFRPFAGTKPPTPPSPNMPLRQLAEAMKDYRAKRTTWQAGIREYQKQLVGEVEGFIRQVSATQGSVAKRFDEKLKARNGRDFNRSDVYGVVLNASRIFGNTGRRFLVLNTDADDLPGKGKPHRVPLTAKELDPNVEVIFVNTSRLPEQAPMFAGLPNPRHHANSMKEAMELVATLIAPKPNSGSAVAELGR